MSTLDGRPTLEEVAARAGVGRGTASRVVNGSPQVSDRAREAVLAAVAELGYVPNESARSLKTRRTGAIALAIAESEERIFGEPFFAGVVRGVSGVLNAAGRQLVLSLVHDDEQADRLGAYLSAQHVDGVLLLSLHDDGALPVDLGAHRVPVVLGGRSELWPQLSYVDVDNTDGGRQAAAHLLAGGRRRLATVAGPQAMASGRDRLDGFLEVAGQAPDLPRPLVEEGDFSELSGWAAMRRLLERAPDVDAVFAASDLMAFGAIRALREAGREVPSDVAVIGYDGTPASATTTPSLTTVRQPLQELGAGMAEMVLRHVEEDPAEPEHRVLPVELVVRDSTPPVR